MAPAAGLSLIVILPETVASEFFLARPAWECARWQNPMQQSRTAGMIAKARRFMVYLQPVRGRQSYRDNRLAIVRFVGLSPVQLQSVAQLHHRSCSTRNRRAPILQVADRDDRQQSVHKNPRAKRTGHVPPDGGRLR